MHARMLINEEIFCPQIVFRICPFFLTQPGQIGKFIYYSRITRDSGPECTCFLYYIGDLAMLIPSSNTRRLRLSMSSKLIFVRRMGYIYNFWAVIKLQTCI